MSHIHLVLEIFVLCTIFFVHQGLADQLTLNTHEENMDASSMLNSMKENPTNSQYMDCNFSSTDIIYMPQISYAQALPSKNDDDTKYYFAVHLTDDNDKGYYGISANMDVYGHNLNVGQLSAGAIWIHNWEGDVNKKLNTIIVGWVVWPYRFNDSRTHLFTVWTKDNHRSTGCVNLDCPGFKVVKGSPISPGDIISPVFGINRKRQTITIRVSKESSSGDWWLYYGINGVPIPVGYFPASLFDSLSTKATQISIGGHARSTKNTIAPPMGSGAFASNPGQASSIHDIWLIHKDRRSTPIGNDARTKVTDGKLYSASPIGRAQFFYGGPGGKS
ncbi:uncharacterized protein LOC119293832 isoform X1 [Triticum dicoccoides]|uniref:uncharacterized protein LOC119293832 isoform X1 n=1 Tax=Triticum dicoccoides TaxID=85692 RepID=UPI00188EA738|nr:uncharacterized protein LOC119293832 isoform X1 [Triticum dicoccoides]